MTYSPIACGVASSHLDSTGCTRCTASLLSLPKFGFCSHTLMCPHQWRHWLDTTTSNLDPWRPQCRPISCASTRTWEVSARTVLFVYWTPTPLHSTARYGPKGGEIGHY